MPIMPAGVKPDTLIAECGPFIGVRDTVELSAQDMRRASSMLNCYVELPELGGDTMQRAGFEQRSQPSTIGGVTAFVGPTVAASPYTSETGTLTNLLLFKRTGSPTLPTEGYFFDGTNAWFPVQYDMPSTYALAALVGTENIADPSVAANRMFQTALGPYAIFAQSGGKVYLLDYANKEILTPSDLTDDVYGRPCIYYGKAFFVLESDRQTIVWSEENDPDIGYQATGYDNSWTFRQTSNAPIMGLAGTNQYLYVFRQNSISSIEGAVNSDFRSFGTLEGISTALGTLAPDSIVNVNDGVWFLDQFCRPHAIMPGRGLVPLWENMRVTLNSADLAAATQFANWARFDPLKEIVLFRISMGGTAKLYAFSSRTLEWLGEWTYGGSPTVVVPTYAWGATLADSAGGPSLSFSINASTMALQNFATQKQDAASDQRDTFSAGLFAALLPTTDIDTPRIAGDPDEVLNIGTVTATGRRLNNAQRAMTVDVQGSNVAFDAGIAMTAPAVAVSGEPCRYTAGVVLLQSRWAQLRLLALLTDLNGPRFSLGTVRIYGTKQRTDPALP